MERSLYDRAIRYNKMATDAMNLLSTDETSAPFAFTLRVGALNALLATPLSALVIALISTLGNSAFPNLLEIGKTALLLCPITFVSIGSFGFVAGVAGSAWICLRKRRIRTIKHLLVESGIVGLLMGVLFVFLDAAINSSPITSISSSRNPAQILLCWVLSAACALFWAYFFRKRFVH